MASLASAVEMGRGNRGFASAEDRIPTLENEKQRLREADAWHIRELERLAVRLKK